MQEPRVDFYFEPRRSSKSARSDGADTVAGLAGLPASVLRQHGALVLDPDDAAALPGQEPPRSTVYRARTLLIPGDIIDRPEVIGPIRRALKKDAGIELITCPVQDDPRLRRANQAVADALLRLPRVAVLQLAKPPSGTPAQPQVIDAWVVLQALRAAAAAQSQRSPKPDRAATEHKLDETAVGQIALEHLLISSAINGSPAKHGGGGATGGAVDSSGTGPGSTDSYVFSGGDTRMPVAVCLDPPRRLPRDECEEKYGRRPVVAVLDTGVRAHWWLNVTPQGSSYHLASDGFVEIDDDIQGAIRTNGEFAASHHDRPRQVIRNAWDKPVTADPLIGELDSDTGHCTFISGIVRQVAPDARVLAVKVMHSGGLIYEGDLLTGLRELAKRVALAEAGDMTKMVDVVSLSLGYFSETEPKKFTSGLRDVIEVLLSLGVAVVAAAGNYATSRKFYPAAFAAQPDLAGAPLVSVGALNPNGSKAMFSDGGSWITAWASGAVIISTFPTDIQGSRTPELRTRAHPDNKLPEGVSLPRDRESLDPDDYRGGFAVWSGTSFSAPLAAARIARELLKEKENDPQLWLGDPGDEPANRRVRAALTSLKWPG
jgi:Subtilase family